MKKSGGAIFWVLVVVAFYAYKGCDRKKDDNSDTSSTSTTPPPSWSSGKTRLPTPSPLGFSLPTPTDPKVTVSGRLDLPPPVPAIDPSRTRRFGDMTFVVVPAGMYTAGSPAAEPGHREAELAGTAYSERQHVEAIPYPFALSRCEVTTADYWSVMDRTHRVSPADARKPMTKVTWHEAVEFCRRLSLQNPGKRFRLPTEVEWEYAARAGTTGMFGNLWGEDELLRAYVDPKKKDTLPLERRAHSCVWFSPDPVSEVGQKRPNAWGLYDMHGNVWEWCADSTGRSAAATLSTDRSPKPIRGGAWTSVTLLDCRSAKRSRQPANQGTAAIGFRPLLENP